MDNSLAPKQQPTNELEAAGKEVSRGPVQGQDVDADLPQRKVTKHASENTNKDNNSSVTDGDTAVEEGGESKDLDTDNITTSDSVKTVVEASITRTKSSPTSHSFPRNPDRKMTINSENRHPHTTSPNSPKTPNTPSYSNYSDPDIDPKHISDIAEDGIIALRLADMEGSTPSRSPKQDNLSSNRSTSAHIPMPKQIIRIERDYSNGELCQFYTAFPLEIDGRVPPRHFQQTITTLNELLEKAHNPKYNWTDNFLACLTLYTSTLCIRSHYDRMVEEICKFLDTENRTTYNNQGLNFRNPQRTAFLFLELEIY